MRNWGKPTLYLVDHLPVASYQMRRSCNKTKIKDINLIFPTLAQDQVKGVHLKTGQKYFLELAETVNAQHIILPQVIYGP